MATLFAKKKTIFSHPTALHFCQDSFSIVLTFLLKNRDVTQNICIQTLDHHTRIN
jgi:hypothetical protein